MSFLTANIDRAIVMTQYDLRAFDHPMGFRLKHRHPKYLDATTGNFLTWLAGRGTGQRASDDFVSYRETPYEGVLAWCHRLADACEASQKEAIGLIVQEMIRQNAQMTVDVADGTMESHYSLRSLSKDNHWGKTVLALREVFEPEVGEAAA